MKDIACERDNLRIMIGSLQCFIPRPAKLGALIFGFPPDAVRLHVRFHGRSRNP